MSILLVAFSSTAYAQILECVDGQGRKEFAATCPPGTVSQKELRPKGAPATEPSTQQDWQEQERAFQQRRLQREADAADAEKKQRQEQYVERRCASARRAMEQLQSGRRLRWTDKATGERQVMTDAEHAVEMRAVSEELRRCPGGVK
jgi:hypothetical protein